MKIEKIKKMKNGKYQIILDNGEKITIYDEVILKYNLLFKKELDSEIINLINNENAYYDIYNKTVKYISTKMRSEYEINNYLDKLEIDNKNNIIQKLKEMNLINDNLFIDAFINDKINLTNYGPSKIKKELLNHKIDENIIDEKLNKFDNEIFRNKIIKIIDKKIKTNQKSEYMFKKKIEYELNNLGYDLNMIYEILNTYKISNDTITKEFDKLYNKLSKKYDGIDLYNQIKRKLYIKGFKMDEINEQIEKRII